MAGKIKGITIEIGGDTKPLEKALSDVNKTSRNLQSELREVEKLLKLDPGNTELLAQKMQLLQNQTSNTTEKLRRLEAAQEQVNRQFREGKINGEQYRAFNRELEQTRISLRQLEDAAEDSSKEVKDLGEETEKSEDKLSKLGKSAGTAAKSVGRIAVKGTATAIAAIGTAALGLGVAAVKGADDAKKALNSLQAQIGATDSEMKSLEDSMMNIYKNNFGEGFQDIADSMALVAQQTNMIGKELETATTNAIMLRDTFGFEVLESTRSVNQLMKEFGVSADEAYTLIAQGAQKGLNANDDLLDTINEYSVHFRQLGFNSEEMFNMLENGAESGSFSIDKLGDGIKEFGIRVKDGSKTTTDAFEGLNLDAEELTKRFAEGGDMAQGAFDKVIKALIDCDDKVLQNAAGVGLFGTMWEDLGVEAIGALTNVQGEFDKSANTLEQINNIRYNDLGSAITGIGRLLQTDILIPLGKDILPVLNEFANALKNGFDDKSLKSFSKSLNTFITEFTDKLSQMSPKFLEIAQNILSGLGTTLMGVMPKILPGLMQAAYELIDILILGVQEYTPMFAEMAVELIESFIEFLANSLPDVAVAAIELVVTLVNSLSESLPDLIPVIVEGILNLITAILDQLPEFIDAAISLITALADGLIKALPKLVEKAPIIIQRLVENIVAAVPKLVDVAIDIIVSLSTYIINNLGPILEAAIKIVMAISMGLIQAIPELWQAAPKLVNAIKDAFSEIKWSDVGWNLVKGIANGISSGVGMIVKAAKNMASSVWGTITSAFDMHSPSRLALKVFQKDFAEEGIGQGILKGIPEVIKDTKRMSESIVNVMQGMPKLDLMPQIQNLSVPSNSLGNSGNVNNNYSGGDIVIQNMTINSKENAQYFAEYLFSLKKTRNRTIGVMT
jgi:phage-related minor tail protein